ncbi:ribosome production factor 2 homolog isoform X2 [Patiria miniata]|uniref:Ribosome production factor 2 homolog n=1 Tax=Patiria miniata TaxID=46514 RepID=A0A914BKT2_PATMI|nr:ribosome production factor 2 homolog isoform X2 [Patiria miniata]
MQRIVKPKTQRAKRALEKRDAKITENTKKCTFIRGGNTSETVTRALKELYILKKTSGIMMQRKNMMRPFEDRSQLEHFAKKNDSSLFLFGSHSKKRPHNLVFGRMFDFQVLDMVELGIDKFTSMYEIKNAKCMSGTKPCLVFSGDLFETEHEYKRLKNLMIDFFRGPVVPNIRLAGLEHVISITAINGKVLFRSYRVSMKKSGSKTPRVELQDIGPSMDLVLRRCHLASLDLYKQSMKKPKQLKPKKKKNIKHDVFGTKLGRIHMESQDLDKLQIRKVKALKRQKPSDVKKDAEVGVETKKAKTDDAAR